MDNKLSSEDMFFMSLIQEQQKKSKAALEKQQAFDMSQKNSTIKKETEDSVKNLYINSALEKVKDNTVKIKFNISDNIYLFRTKKPRKFIEEVIKALQGEDKPKQEWLQIERVERGGAFSMEDIVNYVKFF